MVCQFLFSSFGRWWNGERFSWERAYNSVHEVTSGLILTVCLIAVRSIRTAGIIAGIMRESLRNFILIKDSRVGVESYSQETPWEDP